MPTPPKTEEIQVSWTAIPPGQIGQRPKPLNVGDSFFVTLQEAGTLRIEFKGASPLESGAKVVPAGNKVKVTVPGKFKFLCHKRGPDGKEQTLDPDDPNLPGGGGELEVVPVEN
jgi:hypothetical protein